MPIAAFHDYGADHWAAVEAILREAIADAGFDARLVSRDTASGVIHQRIINNLYEDGLVVCDVSARNPNVMFELGMRLAFDKPTIIVKDDETPFSFDISSIDHLEYPRSLRYAEMVAFRGELASRVLSTSKAAQENPDYSTFLKHLSGITPATMEVQKVSDTEFITKRLDELLFRVSMIERTTRSSMNARAYGAPYSNENALAPRNPLASSDFELLIDLVGVPLSRADELTQLLFSLRGVRAVRTIPVEGGMTLQIRASDHPEAIGALVAEILTSRNIKFSIREV
ncbi:hypothetical protein [Phenylobacterium sp.]|uniref:hypothetical protein n=1 Tax=Phenylobacterium sp. TaxID=1871053 RepID=UPI002730FCA6|nr:hypothetical protein [Phenylobacterium sp.]MDP1873095.1 hypothetical protein [Phenylobacterium sp.]MDP3299522.1 hypothetical protein [Phenylobacterium sp.]